jgi:uncharacterized protein YkwD
MLSKFSVSFFQLALVFSFLFILTKNADCQIEPAKNNARLVLSFGGDNKVVSSSRPRVYQNKETSIETPTRKAVTNHDFERQTFENINRQRAIMNLAPLVWSDDAAKIARLHSENMANFKFFSHEGLDGSMVNDRADSFGISKWRAVGENIAYNRGYANPVEFAVERWMLSTGHRENILNNRWKESGIGIAITEDGAYYFTQVFLQRK